MRRSASRCRQMRGALGLRPVERIGQDQAALGVGVDDLDGRPFMALTTSPGRWALPPGHVLDHRRDRHQRRVRGEPRERRAAAITAAAPDLSCFISSIFSAGLMLIPPESKQTPLPTIASRRSGRALSQPGSLTAISARLVGRALADAEQRAHAQRGHLLRHRAPRPCSHHPRAARADLGHLLRVEVVEARLASVRPDSTRLGHDCARSRSSWLGAPSGTRPPRRCASWPAVSRTRP